MGLWKCTISRIFLPKNITNFNFVHPPTLDWSRPSIRALCTIIFRDAKEGDGEINFFENDRITKTSKSPNCRITVELLGPKFAYIFFFVKIFAVCSSQRDISEPIFKNQKGFRNGSETGITRGFPHEGAPTSHFWGGNCLNSTFLTPKARGKGFNLFRNFLALIK